jgi:putative FmdB family regulatory protein
VIEVTHGRPTVQIARRAEMPVYEYYCDRCQREVTLTMTIGEHDKQAAACPQCGSTSMRPLVGTFFSKTSRKS